jgi:hypothetical protein
VLYTAQVCLDGDKLSASISKIWEWLERREIEPPIFRYRMTSENVVLRLDFKNSADAAAFRDDFDGAVLGVQQTAGAAEQHPPPLP